MFREIIVNDERIHAVIHEPLAHRRASERREILVRRRVGGRGRNDRGVRHRAVRLEHGNRPRDVRVLLPDGDVDAIERPEVLHLPFLARLVQVRLADDGIERDR